MSPPTTSIIREQDPLKQGLKRYQLFIIREIRFYSRARSIKTRIETFSHIEYDLKFTIREQDPLKQGLKLYYRVIAKKYK